MRYIIDRKTNEHERYDGQNYDATKYRIVEADSDGWIKHEGNECPLPEDARCEVKFGNGTIIIWDSAGRCWWHNTALKAYRPILAEKVQEPEPAAELTTNTIDLLGTLARAHEHAAQIPDLEAELREVLAGMGYDLVARSPFVEPEDYAAAIAEAEPSVETPKGYALVPVEPTHKMLDALYNFIPIKYADKAGETMAYKSMLRMAAQYPEPVAQDKVIAGALFDFLGFLTTRDKPTSFGATRNASPAVELLQEWADKRGLDLSDADVENWHSRPAKGE